MGDGEGDGVGLGVGEGEGEGVGVGEGVVVTVTVEDVPKPTFPAISVQRTSTMYEPGAENVYMVVVEPEAKVILP